MISRDKEISMIATTDIEVKYLLSLVDSLKSKILSKKLQQLQYKNMEFITSRLEKFYQNQLAGLNKLKEAFHTEDFSVIEPTYHQLRKVFLLSHRNFISKLDQCFNLHIAFYTYEIESALAYANLYCLDHDIIDDSFLNIVNSMKKNMLSLTSRAESMQLDNANLSNDKSGWFIGAQDTYSNTLENLQNDILEKLDFLFSTEPLAANLKMINDIAGTPAPGKTSISSQAFCNAYHFISQNHDFFLAHLVESKFFQQFCENNISLINLFSARLKGLLSTDDKLKQFRDALISIRDNNDGRALTRFLRHPPDEENQDIIPFLDEMIRNSETRKIINEWKNARIGYFYKSLETLQITQAEIQYFSRLVLHYANINYHINVFLEPISKFNDEYFQKLNPLKPVMDNINFNNPSISEILTLEKINSQLSDCRMKFKKIHTDFIFSMDFYFLQHIADYRKDINSIIQIAQKHVNFSYVHNADKDVLGPLITYFKTLNTDLKNEILTDMDINDAAPDYADEAVTEKKDSVNMVVKYYNQSLNTLFDNINDKINFVQKTHEIMASKKEIAMRVSHKYLSHQFFLRERNRVKNNNNFYYKFNSPGRT